MYIILYKKSSCKKLLAEIGGCVVQNLWPAYVARNFMTVLCVRDRSPEGREGRSYPALGPLGGEAVAPEHVRGKVRATASCRESPPLRSRERPAPMSSRAGPGAFFVPKNRATK